jgi:hypothetical protein
MSKKSLIPIRTKSASSKVFFFSFLWGGGNEVNPFNILLKLIFVVIITQQRVSDGL